MSALIQFVGGVLLVVFGCFAGLMMLPVSGFGLLLGMGFMAVGGAYMGRAIYALS